MSTDWKLHVFDESGADDDVADEATPAAIETTSPYAYNNAKAMGVNDAACFLAATGDVLGVLVAALVMFVLGRRVSV